MMQNLGAASKRSLDPCDLIATTSICLYKYTCQAAIYSGHTCIGRTGSLAVQIGIARAFDLMGEYRPVQARRAREAAVLSL
jgi:hypothetical protein